MKSFTSKLYRAARVSATARSVSTGHTARRARNVVVGRTFGRRLWGRK